MRIKLIKEKKAMDYTFIDDGLNLEKSAEKKESDVKKDKTEAQFRLKENAKLNKLKHKSKITAGHSMQGHSPVYE
jgi:shikimate kinase